jgi:undecaprenyl-diphosphatase
MVELIESVDRALMNWLRAVDTPWLDAAMTWISASGGAGMIWLILAVCAFVRPQDRAAAWRVLLTIALAYTLVDGIVKPLVARPRPRLAAVTSRESPTSASPTERSPRALAPKRTLPPMPRSYSFPSGHAASTFGAAVTVSRMWPQTRVIWWTLALLIGYSRVYLGHHYPLDVIGGAVFGIGLAFWVLGGRPRSTYASTLPHPLPPGVTIRP